MQLHLIWGHTHAAYEQLHPHMAKLVLKLVCGARANLPTMEQIVFRITNRKGESWNVKVYEHSSKQLVVSNQTSNSEVIYSHDFQVHM